MTCAAFMTDYKLSHIIMLLHNYKLVFYQDIYIDCELFITQSLRWSLKSKALHPCMVNYALRGILLFYFKIRAHL